MPASCGFCDETHFGCGVTDGPCKDGQDHASIWSEIEPDTHCNSGQRTAKFSWVAAISEGLLRKAVDSRKELIVRC